MRFSAVIPTYNRSEKLQECIECLFVQEFPKTEFEIIVVDDGSTDNTATVIKKLQKKSPVSLRFFSQKNSGQGVARNYGIQEARGEIILLMGDDIMATPQLFKEHFGLHRTHSEESAAVLGFITWHPRLKVTPLMEFMERGGAIFGRYGGHQFAFDLLEGKKMADYRFFYTSNISLKRSLLIKQKFDPWFSGYGWEDIELGYRLTKKEGLALFYAPEAIAYHDHEIGQSQWGARMKDIGRSAHRLNAKYPELGVLPSARKRRIFEFLGHPLALASFKYLNRDLYFYSMQKKYFLQGVDEGYNEKKL